MMQLCLGRTGELLQPPLQSLHPLVIQHLVFFTQALNNKMRDSSISMFYAGTSPGWPFTGTFTGA